MKDISKKKTPYFDEQLISKLLVEYQQTKDNNIFKQIVPSINCVINGMINKHFIHNKNIYMNRDDAISNAYIEILKSLDSFNPAKGRAYAYINMITKRSLINYYKKDVRITNNEETYTELTKNIDEQNGDIDSTAIVDMNVDYDENNDNQLFSDTNAVTAYKRNRCLPVKDSLIIIYKYLQYIEYCFNFFRTNEFAMKKLLKDIDYDVNACFCFTNLSSIKSKRLMSYNNIISIIDVAIQKTLKYIKNRFKIDENEDIKIYDGHLSGRAISYIRTSILKYMEDDNSNLSNYFDTTDLIAFINYVVRFKMDNFSDGYSF